MNDINICFVINPEGEDIYYMNNLIDHYVYVYLDPRKSGNYVYDDLIFNAEPFYVGSGRGYRKRYHLYENDDNHKNKPKYFKIKKIKSLGTDSGYSTTEIGDLVVNEILKSK